MSGSANNGTYGNPGAPNSPWGPGSGWANPGWDHWRAWPATKPLWIAAMVLGFMFWWPVGLALLFYGIWSRRIGFWGWGWPLWRLAGRMAAQQLAGAGVGHSAVGRMDELLVRRVSRQPASSGNHAFDEYRAETLRRLEEEQKEFGSFLDRLRFAKDKAEFDQFMAERRNRPPTPPEPPTGLRTAAVPANPGPAPPLATRLLLLITPNRGAAGTRRSPPERRLPRRSASSHQGGGQSAENRSGARLCSEPRPGRVIVGLPVRLKGAVYRCSASIRSGLLTKCLDRRHAEQQGTDGLAPAVDRSRETAARTGPADPCAGARCGVGQRLKPRPPYPTRRPARRRIRPSVADTLPGCGQPRPPRRRRAPINNGLRDIRNRDFEDDGSHSSRKVSTACRRTACTDTSTPSQFHCGSVPMRRPRAPRPAADR